MISFKVYILPETAIHQGRATFGAKVVELDDAFVESLDTIQRNELLACLEKGSETTLTVGGMSLPKPVVSDATQDAVRAYLQARIDACNMAKAARIAEQAASEARELAHVRAKILAFLEKPLRECFYGQHSKESNIITFSDVPEDLRAQYDVKLETLRAYSREMAQTEVVADEAKTAEAAARETRIEAFLNEHGSVVDMQRFEVGLLPRKELLDMARDHVFAPLAEQVRYVRLGATDIRHSGECAGPSNVYHVFPADELTADEFFTLESIRRIVATIPEASLEIREHRAECEDPSCPGFTPRRSAKVTIDWNGHTLTREYALTKLGVD